MIQYETIHNTDTKCMISYESVIETIPSKQLIKLISLKDNL